MGYELYRRKRGGPWSVYFLTRDGNRFRRSTKQTDKRAATHVADEWYRKRADPTYQAANETSVEQAVRGLMLALEDAGKRPATRRFYREKCGHLARIFGADLPLARIDAKLVDSYICDRRHEGASRHTVSKELTALRQMLKHARRRGEFDKELSQVMPIGFATGYKPRERRLTMEQAWSLIAELPPGPSRYVAFVCGTTARDAAVSRARGKHWTEDGVLVLDGKTSRSTRLVPVPPMLIRFVANAFALVGPEAMVAPGVSSIRHALDRACKRLGLPHISPNDLRRSVAHWLLEAGVPRDVAAAYMGHANTKMLDMVYGKLDPKELGAALARALPQLGEGHGTDKRADSYLEQVREIPRGGEDGGEGPGGGEPGSGSPKSPAGRAGVPTGRPDVLGTRATVDAAGSSPGAESDGGSEADMAGQHEVGAYRRRDPMAREPGACALERVDVVWTTPAKPGDDSDRGHGGSSENTCAGGESDPGHADFQSGDRIAVSKHEAAGSAAHVEVVRNDRSHLSLSPITRDEANVFIEQHHRHHDPVVGHIFALAASSAGEVVGVAIVGRPVARMLDSGWTAEVTRVCSIGHRNACSFLYGACWRAARALGYRRLITYTLPEEGGASLRGAGWTCLGEAGGGSWSRDARPRVDTHPTQVKFRWERTVAPPPRISAPAGLTNATDLSGRVTEPPGVTPHWLGPAGVFVDGLLRVRQ